MAHPAVALILGQMKGSPSDDEGGEGEHGGRHSDAPDELKAAVEDFCKAIKASDYAAAAIAFKDAVDIAQRDEEEEEEGEGKHDGEDGYGD